MKKGDIVYSLVDRYPVSSRDGGIIVSTSCIYMVNFSDHILEFKDTEISKQKAEPEWEPTPTDMEYKCVSLNTWVQRKKV